MACGPLADTVTDMEHILDQPLQYSPDLIDLVRQIIDSVREATLTNAIRTTDEPTSAQVLQQCVDVLIQDWLAAPSASKAATVGAHLTSHWLALDAIKFDELVIEHLHHTWINPERFDIDSDIVTRIEQLALATGDWSWAYRNAATYIAVTTPHSTADT